MGKKDKSKAEATDIKKKLKLKTTEKDEEVPLFYVYVMGKGLNGQKCFKLMSAMSPHVTYDYARDDAENLANMIEWESSNSPHLDYVSVIIERHHHGEESRNVFTVNDKL